MQRGDLLRKELNIHTFRDLIEYYPLRHVDKTRMDQVSKLRHGQEYAQVSGVLARKEIQGEKRGRRLVAWLKDDSGTLELVWFQGISWMDKVLVPGQRFIVFGRLGFFQGRPQMAHPEVETYTPALSGGKNYLEPVYPVTEKLKSKGLHGKILGKFTAEIFSRLNAKDIPENLPPGLIKKYKLTPRFNACCDIHFPANQQAYDLAVRRLKFEELFFSQLRISMRRNERHRFSKGWVFEKVGDLFNGFFNDHLPFSLTNAQKKVLKDIRKDTGSGKQMNRLLQGDVGSGKTIVALLSMLIAADNGFQSVMMAPTEILARQHFNSLSSMLEGTGIKIDILTGSTSGKRRRELLAGCESGDIHILVGTHAVIEDKVIFKNLGFAVVDEQHKFGVAQRAKLWKKNSLPPHILVMTATPIPRTLALTAYGDLDCSVMDELPPGRKPVTTVHRYEHARPQVMDFIREELSKGRQAYVIYPLIEESSKLDYENLMKGYEEVKSFFPEPRYWISMVHGRQTPEMKEENMQRFVRHDTHIMVSTTVIEVGVNVPNASVMVIESAEKFGLSQLHQLRGRVGRGADQSYCILLTGSKISADARERLAIMVETNDGFRIAEKDLELRGPGEVEGTRQSGVLNFKLADIVLDKVMLETVREETEKILGTDPELELAEHLPLRNYLRQHKGKTLWSKIA